MNRAPAHWDPEKLKWLNAEYVKRLTDAELVERLRNAKPEAYATVASVMDPLAMTAAGRAKFQLLSDHERFLLSMARPPKADDAATGDHLGEAGRAVLKGLVPKLRALPEWAAPPIGAILKESIKAAGVKPPAVMMPFRVALTGQTQTPAIDAIAAALKRDVALERLEAAAG